MRHQLVSPHLAGHEDGWLVARWDGPCGLLTSGKAMQVPEVTRGRPFRTKSSAEVVPTAHGSGSRIQDVPLGQARHDEDQRALAVRFGNRAYAFSALSLCSDTTPPRPSTGRVETLQPDNGLLGGPCPSQHLAYQVIYLTNNTILEPYQPII